MTTLPPSCAVVMKSGNLNFLEPSGPLQACNGTALPFIYPTERTNFVPEMLKLTLKFALAKHENKLPDDGLLSRNM